MAEETTQAAADAPETGAPATSASATPDAAPAPADGLVEADLLVEDVSIDGMCGVY
jgi:mycofactocin precursor